MKFKVTLLVFLIVLVLGCLFISKDTELRGFIWVLLTVFFVITSVGVIELKFNFFVKAICRTKNSGILFTFDDGPHPVNTLKILEILKENHVKAIFFVVGEKALKYPEIIRQIHADGHQIGNHTTSHPPMFALMSGKRVWMEIEDCQNTLIDNFGITPVFFRPPIGYTNPIIGRVVRELNIPVMGWTFRSWDTVLRSPKWLLKRSLKGLRPGTILLFHDTLDQTVKVLPAVLSHAAKMGLNPIDQKSTNHEMDA